MNSVQVKRVQTVVLCALLCGCAGKQVRIEGRFAGAVDAKMPLEMLGPGHRSVVDTISTDDQGHFSAKVKLSSPEAMIYNLQVPGGLIPLVLSGGERIKLNSAGNLARNYTVSGSPESELICELNAVMTAGAEELDSLTTLFLKTPGEEARKEITSQYLKAYYRIKQDQVRFIVTYPGSLAAVYALYQRLPNDNVLFNGEGDVVYYRVVADSLASVHPKSPYLTPLKGQISRMEGQRALADKITGELTQISFPELDMPDMYGRKQKLSALEGNVILIDFWTAADPRARINNAELKQLYDQYKDRGFVIYQVSVDESKSLWVTTIQSQRIPWISVCDLRGTDSPSLRLYGVKALPANIIIDKQSNIVARDLYGEKLEVKIRELTK